MNNALSFTVGDGEKNLPEQTFFDIPEAIIERVDAGEGHVDLIFQIDNVSESFLGDVPDIYGPLRLDIEFYGGDGSTLIELRTVNVINKGSADSYSSDERSIAIGIPVGARGFILRSIDGRDLVYRGVGENSVNLFYRLSVDITAIFVDSGAGTLIDETGGQFTFVDSIISFENLADTPAALGTPGEFVVVNPAGDALIFTPSSGGGTGLTSAQTAKLAGIEDDATADQTDTEIVTAIDTELGNPAWKLAGSIVVANPPGTDGVDLTRVVIGQDNFNIPTSSLDTDPIAFRIGWDQQGDNNIEGVFTYPTGSAIGTTAGLAIPVYPTSYTNSPNLYLHFWVAGDPTVLSITDDQGNNWVTRTNAPEALTVGGVAGMAYISKIRYAPPIIGHVISFHIIVDGLLTEDDVETWALEGNADRFPAAKMGSGTASSSKVLFGDRTWKDAPTGGGGGGGEVNVKANWDEADTSSDSFIENKPTIITSAQISKLASIPVGAEVNVQADWNEASSTNDAFIKNKPAALIETFVGLSDTPAALGTSGQIPVVNSAGDALEFINAATGGGGGTGSLVEIFNTKTSTNGTYSLITGQTFSAYDFILVELEWGNTEHLVLTIPVTAFASSTSTRWAAVPDSNLTQYVTYLNDTQFILASSQSDEELFKIFGVSLGGGSVGSTTFEALTDTPAALGSVGQIPVVNAAGDALEFIDIDSASSFNGARIGLATSIDLDGTYSAIPWSSEKYDLGDWWASSAPTRLTVPAGVTRVRLHTSFSVHNLSAPVTIDFRLKKGSAALDTVTSHIVANHGDVGTETIITPVISVAGGDYFELWKSSTDTFMRLQTSSYFSIEAVAGSGGGVRTFTGLTDTPGTIEARKLVKGNAAGTDLEFVAEPPPSEPIPVVARLPAFVSGPDLVFLSHDYTIGTREDATVIVGVFDPVPTVSLIGYSNGLNLNAFGTISKPSPLVALFGQGTISSYSLETVISQSKAWLDSFTHIQIGTAEYALLPSFVSSGFYERRIQNYPSSLSAFSVNINFKRLDGTFYFNGSVTTREDSGLYEKSGSEYARLTSKGFIHIDGTGSPVSLPTAAAQSYVDDLGRLWVSGDRVTSVTSAPLIGDMTFTNAYLVFVSSLTQATNGQFVAQHSGGFLQRQEMGGSPTAASVTWTQAWTYIATVDNTAAIRNIRDNSIFMGEFSTKAEAALKRATYSDASKIYVYTNTAVTPRLVEQIISYTPGVVTSVDHFFWRGPHIINQDLVDYIARNILRFEDNHGLPPLPPNKGGQLHTNNAGEIYVGSDALVNVAVPPSWSTVPIDVVWTKWKGVSHTGGAIRLSAGAADGDFEYRTSPVSSFFQLQGLNTFIVTFDELSTYLRSNSLLALVPAGFISVGTPHSRYIGIVDNDAAAASLVAHNSYIATSPYVWLDRNGTNPTDWKLRLAATGAFVAGTVTRQDVLFWRGPIRAGETPLVTLYEDTTDFEYVDKNWRDRTLNSGDIIETDMLEFSFKSKSGGYSRATMIMPGYEWLALPITSSVDVAIPDIDAETTWFSLVAGIGASSSVEVVDGPISRVGIRKRSATSLSIIAHAWHTNEIGKIKIVRRRT